MPNLLEEARRIVGHNVSNHVPFALEQYQQFMAQLNQERRRLIAVHINIEEDVELMNSPESVRFSTHFGDMLMQRVFVLKDERLSVALVFSDTVDDGVRKIARELSVVQLNPHSSWVDGTGRKVDRNPMTDEIPKLFAYSVVVDAVAAILTLNTKRAEHFASTT